jgi:hypothetical protein
LIGGWKVLLGVTTVEIRMSKVTAERLERANAILRVYASECCLEYSRGFYLKWTDFRGESHRLRWVPNGRGSDFPTISRKVPFGGPCCCATMELTRWAAVGCR